MMSYKLLFKPKNQGLIALIVAATAITGGIAIYGISNFGKVEKSSVIRYPVVVRFESVNYSGTNTNNFSLSELAEL